MLEANLNVKALIDRAIQYTTEFNAKAAKEKLQEKGSSQIFIENGFVLMVIGSDKSKETLKRWRKAFQLQDEEGFFEERQGKSSTDHSPSKALAVEKKLEKSEALDGNVHPGAMIHSDQRFHYTHPEDQQLVKDRKLTQSMSHRGNCIDNTSMESFFCHFKADVNFKQATSFSGLKGLVDDYMEEYNGTRKQRNLKKMTPAQYRSHLSTT